MENRSLLSAVGKLAIAGEQAVFTVEQMIEVVQRRLERRESFGLDFLAS